MHVRSMQPRRFLTYLHECRFSGGGGSKLVSEDKNSRTDDAAAQPYYKISPALCPQRRPFRIKSIRTSHHYSTRALADEVFILFRCEELAQAKPSAHVPRQCRQSPPPPNVVPFFAPEYPSVGAWTADIFTTPAMQHCTTLRLDNRFLDVCHLPYAGREIKGGIGI